MKGAGEWAHSGPFGVESGQRVEIYHVECNPDSKLGFRTLTLHPSPTPQSPEPSLGTGRVADPYGGERPFHHKSTCIKKSTLGPCGVQIWSRCIQIWEQQRFEQGAGWGVRVVGLLYQGWTDKL